MKIEQIKQQADGFTVPSLLCRVKTVYPPSNPTPAQEKHGIHSQDLVVKDDTGEIKVQLTRPNQHVGKGLENQLVTFSSTENDGKLMGVQVSVYKETYKVSIGKMARIEAGMKPAKPAPRPASAPQPESGPTLDDRVAALAAHHRKCYEHVKVAYGDAVPAENLLSVASCLFIETKNAVRVEPSVAPALPPEPTLEERYDEVAAPLLREFGREVVDFVHDKVLEHKKGNRDAAYTWLIGNPDEFRRMCETRVSQEGGAE